MPVVFREGNIRFSFYADEGDPREPAHIHAIGPGVEAKFWIVPTVTVARNAGFKRHEMRRLEEIVVSRREEIEEVWNEFFGV